MDLSLFAFGPTGWGDELVWGFVITLSLAITSYAFGTLIGLCAALAELSSNRFVGVVFALYAAIFRSVPELLVLFLVYYGGSLILNAAFSSIGLDFTIAISSFGAGVIALSLVHGAYTTEVFKGAFRAVPTGQREAAMALGLPRGVAFWRIILPLALRYAFPGLTNLWMVMIKNTPLVSAIGVADLISQASTAGENTKAFFSFFLAALAVYLLVSALSMIGQEAGQKRLFRHLPVRPK